MRGVSLAQAGAFQQLALQHHFCQNHGYVQNSRSLFMQYVNRTEISSIFKSSFLAGLFLFTKFPY